MRIRTIKPEFWTDSFMVQLSPIGRLIYVSLWTAADDHGYLPDESDRLAMLVMPREDPLTFDDWLQFFEASGRLEMLTDGIGHTYYRIAKWEDHQRIDRPTKSKIHREGSRKIAIPLETRREVARKYGCPEGSEIEAKCFYCGDHGRIHWHKLFSGRPSAWVTFPGLELDHLEPEDSGGSNTQGNIVLACRKCNRSKGTKLWIERLCSANPSSVPTILARNLERSSTEQGSGNREHELFPEPSAGAESSSRKHPSDKKKLGKKSAELGYDPVAIYCEEFKLKFGSSPTILGPAARAAHVIARTMSDEKYRTLIRAYLNDPTQWLIDKGHPLELLQGRINRYTQEIAQREAEPEQDHPAGGGLDVFEEPPNA